MREDIRQAILMVRSCSQCPFLLKDSNLNYCCKLQLEVEEFSTLHKDCPLEKYKY